MTLKLAVHDKRGFFYSFENWIGDGLGIGIAMDICLYLFV
jgi:hypothetical protein